MPTPFMLYKSHKSPSLSLSLSVPAIMTTKYIPNICNGICTMRCIRKKNKLYFEIDNVRKSIVTALHELKIIYKMFKKKKKKFNIKFGRSKKCLPLPYYT